MKISTEWLNEFIKTQGSTEDISNVLSMLGLEAESSNGLVKWLFLLCARLLYPSGYRFGAEEVKEFNRGYSYGTTRRKRNIHLEKFDIDEEADLSNKSVNSSYRRIARSFGLDFSNENKKLIHKLSEKVSKQQLSLISKNLDKLTKKFRMSKDTPLILAGIGQEVLKDFFKNKNTKLFQKFIKSKNISIKTEATYHAPALSIACLLNENID